VKEIIGKMVEAEREAQAILSEADAQAREILDKAHAEASGITEGAGRETRRLADELIETARNEAKTKRAERRAVFQKNKRTLGELDAARVAHAANTVCEALSKTAPDTPSDER